MLAGDLHARMEIALDPGSDAESLSTIAPRAQDHEDHRERLCLALISHEHTSPGIVSRFLTSPLRNVRLAAVQYPGLTSASLLIAAHDPDPEIARIARARMDAAETPESPPGRS